jgi:hypothetical protein
MWINILINGLILNTQERFQTNSVIHSFNTRNKNQLHRPIANHSCFQKSAYYAGIKIFNSLPSSLKSLVNKKAQFKVAKVLNYMLLLLRWWIFNVINKS